MWDRPCIYVASLTDYNAGILHGDWISAEVSAEAVQETIQQMLDASPTAERYGEVAEEWAIHDYSGFGKLHLGEYESLDRVCWLAEGIVTYGDAFAAWVACHDDEDEVLTEEFESHYLGEFASAEEYGEHLLDELGIKVDDLPGVPEGIRPYVHVDVAGWVRDLTIEGAITTAESPCGVYVFWGMDR
jgi:antirestriction protein